MNNFSEFVTEFGIQVFNSHNVSIEYRIFTAHQKISCRYVASLHGGYETVPDLLDSSFVEFLNNNVHCWLSLANKNETVLRNAGVDDTNFHRSFNALPIPSDWIDRNSFRVGHSIPSDGFVIVQSSRAILDKGWQISIDAVSLVRDRLNKDIYLVLIGDGPDFEKIRSKNSHLSFIRFLGFVNQPVRYLKCFDLGVFPSTFAGETFPLFLLECFQAALPVIANDIGEIDRMINGGSGGPAGSLLKSGPENSDLATDLSSELERIILDEYARSRLSHQALQRSYDYSISSLTDFYISHFSQAS